MQVHTSLQPPLSSSLGSQGGAANFVSESCDCGRPGGRHGVDGV